MNTADQKAIKQLQFWAAIAFSVAGVGFFAAMYLNRYAQAADLEKLGAKVESHEPRISHMEATVEHLEEDLHWQREQTQRIADRVGAEIVPPPKH